MELPEGYVIPNGYFISGTLDGFCVMRQHRAHTLIPLWRNAAVGTHSESFTIPDPRKGEGEGGGEQRQKTEKQTEAEKHAVAAAGAAGKEAF